MGNDQEDTSTTVQQTDAENPGQGSEDVSNDQQTQEQQQNLIPQSRFNEQTKARRDAERERDLVMQQNRELMAQLAQVVTQRSAPQPQEPEFDPDERKKLEYFLTPLQRELAAMRGQLAAQSAESEVRRAARSDTPPEVLEHATRLVADWRRQGANGGPQEALRYAYGDYLLRQTDEAAEVRVQRQQFNRSAAGVQSGGAAPMRKSGPKQLSEAEIERLSPEGQAEYYSTRLGDEPL
jgi:hypothetical protein